MVQAFYSMQKFSSYQKKPFALGKSIYIKKKKKNYLQDRHVQLNLLK